MRLPVGASKRRLIAAVTTFLFLPIAALGQTLTVVNVPGAVETSITGINDSGVITGTFLNAITGPIYGFVHTPGGAFQTLIAPVNPMTGLPNISTSPTCINSAGVIAGNTADAAQSRGFLRTPDGKFTMFDADPTPNTITIVNTISSTGEIAGQYGPRNGALTHGFVRDAHGTIQTFDIPPQGNFAVPKGFGPNGLLIGATTNQGFIRWQSKPVKIIAIPNALIAGLFGMNSSYIAIGGFQHDINTNYGFFMNLRGQFLTFPLPGLPMMAWINASGTAAFQYYNATINLTRVLVREPNGNTVEINPPGGQTIYLSGLNDAGTVVGYFYAPGTPSPSGFVWNPR